MNKYDIVIIGSGLGGLECAAVLSKEGYNVCVLEKNKLFGGCFQSFKRHGHVLDTGIHYVGSLDEGQTLNQYFKYFGILDKLKMQRLDADGFDVINYAGREYNYAMGHDQFVEHLASEFPAERNNLIDYTRQLKSVGDLIGVEHLRKGNFSAGGMSYFSKSASGEIERVVGNKSLQQILAGSALLYGGLRDESTFYHHAMINNSYIESAYRFVDGSMQVTDELINVIRANGGTVRDSSEVTRIVVEGDSVTSVMTGPDERIEAKYVISNIHPSRTMELLDKNSLVKKAYISRINSIPNSYGIFTVYLIFKKNTVKYSNKNYYLHSGDNVWHHSDFPDDDKIHSCLFSMQANSESQPYATVVSLLMPMYMDVLEKWKDTTIEHRGAEYKDFKAAKAQELIDFTIQYFPHLKGNIESVHVTTPLTYRDYTATVDGSAYGMQTNCKSPLTTLISPKTKIRNLLMTGQNLNVHGALGVTLTAMITCAEIIDGACLAKKIGNI